MPVMQEIIAALYEHTCFKCMQYSSTAVQQYSSTAACTNIASKQRGMQHRMDWPGLGAPLHEDDACWQAPLTPTPMLPMYLQALMIMACSCASLIMKHESMMARASWGLFSMKSFMVTMRLSAYTMYAL
jgi:hypothetical protein